MPKSKSKSCKKCCEATETCKLKVEKDATVCGAIKPFRYVRVRKTTQQGPIGAGAEVEVQFDVKQAHGLDFDLVTSRFIAPRSGIYSFTTQVNSGEGDQTGQDTSRSIGIALDFGQPNQLFNSTVNAVFDLIGLAHGAHTAVYFLHRGQSASVIFAHDSAVPVSILPGFPVRPTFLEVTQLR